MNNKLYEKFSGLYPVMRTIRMGLEPVEKTAEYIYNTDILAKDKKIADAVECVKGICNRAYKDLIRRGLTVAGIESLPYLEQYALVFFDSKVGSKYTVRIGTVVKELGREQALNAYAAEMRRYIGNSLAEADDLSNYQKAAQLCKEIAPHYISTQEEEDALAQMYSRTGLLNPYIENRKLLFDVAEKHGSVATRAINENLPIYLNNMISMRRILSALPAESVDKLEKTVCMEAGLSLHEISTVTAYGKVLTQEGIDKYNLLIGGYTVDQSTKVQGINEVITQYNKMRDINDKALPSMKKLQKQILSDHVGFSFRHPKFTCDRECATAVLDLHKEILDTADQIDKLFAGVANGEYDTEHIYINENQLHNLSQDIYGTSHAIRESLSAEYNAAHQRDAITDAKKAAAFDVKRDKALNAVKNISVATIARASAYVAGKADTDLLGAIQKHLSDLRLAVLASYPNAEKVLDKMMHSSRKVLHGKEEDHYYLKAYLDAAIDYMRYAKIYTCTGNVIKDMGFYADYEAIEVLDDINACYNMVRNYATEKPYNPACMQLFFGCAPILGGWDDNKRPSNRGLFLLRNGNIYLGVIVGSKVQQTIDKIQPARGTETAYQLWHSHGIPNVTRAIGSIFSSGKWTSEHPIPDHIQRILNRGSHKRTSESFNVADMKTMIDYYKDCIAHYNLWSSYHFTMRDTDEYSNINEFYADLDESAYVAWLDDVSAASVDALVDSGVLYLFRVRNRDLDGHAKGIPDSYAIIMRHLFSAENVAQNNIQLAGHAKIMYRPASIAAEERIIHHKGETIANKNPNCFHTTHTLDKDIIKDRRYTVDTYHLHLPIKYNPSLIKRSDAYRMDFDTMVRQEVVEKEKNFIIGINRGIRNLLYACVIDEDGNIVEQRSLNVIDSGNRYAPAHVDYADMLESRRETRDKDRKTWSQIAGIATLKDGYLSQAVRVIVDLMQKYDAVLALEDLNSDFVDRSAALEQNVYQRFQTRLVQKLEYLTNKRCDIHDDGGLLHGYQLTFGSRTNFQNGFVFFVPPAYTTNIDPVTGFVNLFTGSNYPHYVSLGTSVNFWSKFRGIRYNADKEWFEFDFAYSDFGIKTAGRDEWTVVSEGTRLNVYKDSITYKCTEEDMTSKLLHLFADYSLDINGDIQKQILTYTSKDFYCKLYEAFNLILKMRNSKPCTNIDYIASPVLADDGTRFVSQTDDTVHPCCAAANGAYNLARKCALVIKRMRNAEDLRKASTTLSNADWLKEAQHSYLLGR